MAIAPGSLGFEQLSTSPAAPPVGFCILYSKTDNVVYLKDSSGTEIALGTASGITSLTGEATGTGPGAATVTLSNSAVIGKVLTGFSSGPNSVVLATDTILEAIEKLQAQVSASSSSAITALTGDVTASGPGSVAATVVSVGSKSAASVATSVNDTQAATAANTASTIVKRDASGNFSANVITADLTGAASDNVLKSGDTMTGALTITVAGTGLDVTNDASIGGTITASNLSGTNTGDVTITDTNSVNLSLSGQDISADVNLSGSTLAIDGSGVKVATGGITNNEINAAAAIAYSKLNLSTSIVNADISSSAAIAVNKLAALTASRALESDGSGVISVSSVTSTELGYVSGVTSPIQTQINSITGSGITSLTGDVTATGPGASAATVAFVGTSSAANVHSAELLANAATNLNTASTIVKRDASGDILISNVNGVAPEAHASRHLPTGADPITTAAPSVNLDASTSNAAGTANSLARSDHGHAISTGAASTQTPDQSNAAGSSADLARADHVHNIPSGTPVQIGTSNFPGAAASFALSDHVHSHGNQTSGTLHAAATGAVNGFMSSADKTKLDAATASNTPSTLVLRDGSGDFSAGTITAALTGAASANLLKAGDTMNGFFRSATVALTDAATINTDAALGNIFTVTLGGNRTLANPTNSLDGQKVTWRIRQDATGSRTLTFDSAFNFPPSLAGLSLSTSPNTFDYLGAQYNSITSKWDVLAFTSGLS